MFIARSTVLILHYLKPMHSVSFMLQVLRFICKTKTLITFLQTVMMALKSDIVASFLKLLLSNRTVYVRRDRVRERSSGPDRVTLLSN